MSLTKRDLGFLRLCATAADQFSTCSKRQYASFLLDERGRVVGFGYNGSPPGYAHCVDGACPRAQQGSASGSSYDNCISIHAEQNALLYCIGDPYTAYVNGVPCFTCAKLLAGRGLKRVVAIKDESYAMWEDVEKYLTDSGAEVVWLESIERLWQPML